MRIVALVVALVACVHAGLWAISEKKVSAPDIDGPLASMSYAPFAGATHADEAKTSVAQIRSDLQLLSRHTRAIRTYSSTGGVELVPPVAAEFGLKVTAGAWLDTNTSRNEREMRSVIELARRNPNVQAIVVGNEHVMRGEIALLGDEKLTPEENEQIASARNATELARIKENISVARLIKLIQRVKREVNVPVTTGEIWNTWRDHPELVSQVDFIAVHLLPYWESINDKGAVDAAQLLGGQRQAGGGRGHVGPRCRGGHRRAGRPGHPSAASAAAAGSTRLMLVRRAAPAGSVP